MSFSIGVDAWNLAADHRGMGRYARRILNDWKTNSDIDVTLIVRNANDVQTLQAEFPYKIETKPGKHDAVWYPWNGIRFEPNARSVVTLHDAFAFTLPHGNLIARWREQSPIRRAIKTATALASNSAWTANEAARVFKIDPNRFTIVPPVPDEFWQPVETPYTQPYILVVAGPDERKNLQTLFNAFARAFPEQSVTLKVVGTLRTDDEEALENARFRYEHLNPTDEHLRELYSGATAVAVPSTYEGYGIMAVEAMACGAPVIASNASALPEACDNAAMLIPPKDTQAWAHNLARIVSDGDLRQQLKTKSLERTAKINRSAPARETLRLLQNRS